MKLRRIGTGMLIISAVLFPARLSVDAQLHAREGKPLWPHATYTTGDRDHAVEKALNFIYSVAKDPAAFRNNGSDLLFAFVNISTSNANQHISSMALTMGHERAIEWRRQHSTIPADASASTISELIYGSYSARELGVPDSAFDALLRAKAARFTVTDYLGFNPSAGPPPENYPGYSQHALFMDALITTYFGKQFGTTAEGRYEDVLRWLPVVRPYPEHKYSDWGYYDAIYALTHIIYTYNHYNLSKIDRGCFPDEFAYLKE